MLLKPSYALLIIELPQVHMAIKLMVIDTQNLLAMQEFALAALMRSLYLFNSCSFFCKHSKKIASR